MFTKIGKSGGHSSWNAKLDDVEVAISAKWYGSVTGDSVYVEILELAPGGRRVERRGTMHVERAIISETIFFATVSSLEGDVKGSDRNVKNAAEQYASEVARIVAQEWAASPSTAEAPKFSSVEDAHAVVQSLAEALGALSILTGRGDVEIDEMAAKLKTRLDAAVVARNAFRKAVPA